MPMHKMQTLLYMAAILLPLALAAPTQAQTYPWCAVYSGGMGGALIAASRRSHNAGRRSLPSAAFMTPTRSTLGQPRAAPYASANPAKAQPCVGFNVVRICARAVTPIRHCADHARGGRLTPARPA